MTGLQEKEELAVLIVEGSREQRRLLSGMVGKMGWRAIEASCGRVALDIMEKSPPHLVLLEVDLEDMDGFEVCRRIRQTSNVPIIMVTYRCREEDMLNGLACGADDYVVKPYSPVELVARMRAVINRSRGKSDR